MKSTTDIIDAIVEILKQNPECSISGSHALIAQGYKIRRLPIDIDVYVPLGENFDLKNVDSVEDGGSGDDSDQKTYEWKGSKVNVFFDHNSSLPKYITNSISYVYWYEVIKFKVIYALCPIPSAQKHYEDIMWFLKENKKSVDDLPF